MLLSIVCARSFRTNIFRAPPCSRRKVWEHDVGDESTMWHVSYADKLMVLVGYRFEPARHCVWPCPFEWCQCCQTWSPHLPKGGSLHSKDLLPLLHSFDPNCFQSGFIRTESRPQPHYKVYTIPQYSAYGYNNNSVKHKVLYFYKFLLINRTFHSSGCRVNQWKQNANILLHFWIS